jgi:hypothetical protein
MTSWSKSMLRVSSHNNGTQKIACSYSLSSAAMNITKLKTVKLEGGRSDFPQK